jgi:pimeloyl-ACP methyl ester carboxylesterase
MPHDRVIYLPGIGGHPGLSPAMKTVAAAGFDVLVPDLPGFDGRSGFVPPDDHLAWLCATWDAIDDVLGGDTTPCHFVGASVGGMLAADVGVFRPELVASLTLIDPFGIFDETCPGFDLFAVVSPQRPAHLFAKGVPDEFGTRFDDRGPDEAPVARYLTEIAMASLTWPLGDRRVAGRLHRLRGPRLTVWGELDELLPLQLAHRWSDDPVVIAGAGHLAEWDAPDEIGAAVLSFLKAQ